MEEEPFWTRYLDFNSFDNEVKDLKNEIDSYQDASDLVFLINYLNELELLNKILDNQKINIKDLIKEIRLKRTALTRSTSTGQGTKKRRNKKIRTKKRR
jgi:hypothetical protein